MILQRPLFSQKVYKTVHRSQLIILSYKWNQQKHLNLYRLKQENEKWKIHQILVLMKHLICYKDVCNVTPVKCMVYILPRNYETIAREHTSVVQHLFSDILFNADMGQYDENMNSGHPSDIYRNNARGASRTSTCCSQPLSPNDLSSNVWSTSTSSKPYNQPPSPFTSQIMSPQTPNLNNKVETTTLFTMISRPVIRIYNPSMRHHHQWTFTLHPHNQQQRILTTTTLH